MPEEIKLKKKKGLVWLMMVRDISSDSLAPITWARCKTIHHGGECVVGEALTELLRAC